MSLWIIFPPIYVKITCLLHVFFPGSEFSSEFRCLLDTLWPSRVLNVGYECQSDAIYIISLATGKCGADFNYVNFKHVLLIDILCFSC